MNLDKDKIKESLTEEDVKKILSDLGSEEPQRDRQGNLIFTTVCHNHSDGSHKLYYYSESQNFYCFTECSKNMDIYELVISTQTSQGFNYSFPDALRYVAKITGKDIRVKKQPGFGKQSTKIDDWDWLNKIGKSKPKMTEELPAYDEAVLDVFMPYQNHWADEGISCKSANKFEVYYYFKRNQIIFVNRDENGRMIGIRARNLDEDLVNSGMKYMPAQIGNILYSYPSMFNLYGLYQNKNNISRIRKVLLVEGEKSVLKNNDNYGFNNFAVAVQGSNISSWQRDKVLSTGAEEVFIGFDKFRAQKENESDKKYQEAIIKYQERLLRIAHMFSPYIKTYILWDKKGLLDYNDSPLDKGRHTLETLMKNKIEIRTKDVEIEDMYK